MPPDGLSTDADQKSSSAKSVAAMTALPLPGPFRRNSHPQAVQRSLGYYDTGFRTPL